MLLSISPDPFLGAGGTQGADETNEYKDYLGGAFHGSGHEEAWGVFDTADHVGVFGAKRQP